MRVKILFLIVLLPLAQAQDIPALEGSGTTRFIAGWSATDNGVIPAQGTQFTGLYGIHAPRTTETDVITQATFYYNITNFRVSSNVNACGGLGVGETFTFAVRKNGADTSLTGSCNAAALANSFTLDNDIVVVAPGDRLSIRVSVDSTLLARNIRTGMSLEGFKTVNITTVPVTDMTNEIIEALNLYAPLLVLIAIVIWAEASKEFLVYILALLAGTIVVVGLWSEISELRVIIVAAIILILARAVTIFLKIKESED